MKRLLKRFLRVVLTILIVLFSAYQGLVCFYHFSNVPPGMSALFVNYAEEKSWGFGPGGNETGVVSYVISSSTVGEIEQKGLRYFEELRTRSNIIPRSYFGQAQSYEGWHETPIQIEDKEDHRWIPSGSSDLEDIPRVSIQNYLNRYGFGIDLRSKVEEQINNAITRPGSFYTYTINGGGLIIVAPAIKRIFLVYAG